MDPKRVASPKSKIDKGSIHIIYGDSNSYFSIATMIWDGEPRVGIRWNNSGLKQNGYPVGAFGHPQWFILPKEIAMAYAKQIGDITIIEKIKATSDEPLK